MVIDFLMEIGLVAQLFKHEDEVVKRGIQSITMFTSLYISPPPSLPSFFPLWLRRLSKPRDGQFSSTLLPLLILMDRKRKGHHS